MKRALQTYVLNDLSKRILAGDVDKEKPMVVDLDGDSLIFKN